MCNSKAEFIFVGPNFTTFESLNFGLHMRIHEITCDNPGFTTGAFNIPNFAEFTVIKALSKAVSQLN